MVGDDCLAAGKTFFKERRGGTTHVMVSFDDSPITTMLNKMGVLIFHVAIMILEFFTYEFLT